MFLSFKVLNLFWPFGRYVIEILRPSLTAPRLAHIFLGHEIKDDRRDLTLVVDGDQQMLE